MLDGILELVKLLREAERASSDAPRLARIIGELPKHGHIFSFGQTVYWDEPMKAVVIEQMSRHGIDAPFIFGVHDTDYFSKAHSAVPHDGGFTIIKRNGGSTANVWTAACETATLLGCEAAPTISDYISCGIPISELAKHSDEGNLILIDRWTEAWGWRAIIHNSKCGPVTGYVRLNDVLPKMKELIKWAVESTLRMVDAPSDAQRSAAEGMLKLVDECAERVSLNASLSEFYMCLYRRIVEGLIGRQPKNLSTTRSLDFFRFNSNSCSLDRFKLLDIFLSPHTRGLATFAYNEAVAGTGIYPLSEFGEGALPFDLVSTQFGKGTVCIDGNWLIILVGANGKRSEVKACEPITNRLSLARCIEEAFGKDCALVGKAIMTPIMLCSEGVMVLSETGSAYMHIVRRFVSGLREAGVRLSLSPILRVCYPTYDAMRSLNFKLRLPPHLAKFIGGDVVSGDEFALSWRDAVKLANKTIEGMLASPSPWSTFELIEHGAGDGEAEQLRWQLEATSDQLRRLGREIDSLVMECRWLTNEERNLVKQLMNLQLQCSLLKRRSSTHAGEHEKLKSERQKLSGRVRELQNELRKLHSRRRDAVHRLRALVYSDEAFKLRLMRRELYLKVFDLRLSLARDALLTAALPYSNFRPCAWWLAVIDTDGKWWQSIVELARARFEEW